MDYFTSAVDLGFDHANLSLEKTLAQARIRKFTTEESIAAEELYRAELLKQQLKQGAASEAAANIAARAAKSGSEIR
jgi:hypothetical protein